MHGRCLEKGFTDSCKDIILHIVTVALATRYMELSQQYNDNIPAKSFYVHMVLEEKKVKGFPLPHPDRVRTLFLGTCRTFR